MRHRTGINALTSVLRRALLGRSRRGPGNLEPQGGPDVRVPAALPQAALSQSPGPLRPRHPRARNARARARDRRLGPRAHVPRRDHPGRVLRTPAQAPAAVPQADGGHRDLYSWCDLEASRYPTTRHRCAHCTDASDLYRRANRGDWQAEVRLHRLATRASMRLLAERRAWAETRRHQRAARTPEPGPPPVIWAMLGWKRWRDRRAEYPPATERWFIVERREAEAKLVRAHT